MRARAFALMVLATGCGASAARSPAAAPAAAAAPVRAAAAPRTPPDAGPALESAGYSVRVYTRPTVAPENRLRTSGGIVRVRAPLAAAYAAAIRYDAIRELNPYIETSRVVAVDGDATDVYIRVPTVLGEHVWAVVRFRPVAAPGGFACAGEMVRGNLDDLRIGWRLVAAGPDETLAQLEVLADPALPLPRSWVTRDTQEGVYIMLERFREKVEARASSAPAFAER